MGRDKVFPCLLSTDMYYFVFSCVVYFSLKAFGKNRKIKFTEKLAILQYFTLL